MPDCHTFMWRVLSYLGLLINHKLSQVIMCGICTQIQHARDADSILFQLKPDGVIEEVIPSRGGIHFRINKVLLAKVNAILCHWSPWSALLCLSSLFLNVVKISS